MIIREEAEADLAAGRSWYERREVGLGDEFVEAVGEVFRRITQFPESYQVIHADVRRARICRFAFLIYDRLIGDEVAIMAVLHSHCAPRI